MKRHMLKTLVGLAFLVVLTGCQALTGKSAGQNIDDGAITASVKAKLVTSKASHLTRIDVDTNEGVVYLNGTVNSTADKITAEEAARSVHGVKNVVNNLQVPKS